ncbi:MAG: DUF4374 domain-containing protein [Chryseolinea sp.]
MKLKLYTAVLICAMISFASCDDDVKKNLEKVNYALTATSGTFPNQTAYVFGTNEFPSGSLGTSQAAELTGGGMMYKFGSEVYVATFGEPATLRKYSFDATGVPQQTGSITVPGLKTFGAVEFVSATEAYAASNGFGGVPKLVKFNPSTMQILTTVNLTGLQMDGATEVYYLGMVIRDNYLFMGVNYQDATFSNLADSVFVAVISTTTNNVVKLIADGRSSEMWNGGTASSFSPNSLIKDANDDIYVTGYASNGKPSGVLRIKDGTTDFDADYFFNLDVATGMPCLGLFHFDNGMTFTIRYSEKIAYPFDTDANFDPLAAAEIYKIDLNAKTSEGRISADLPKLFGNSIFMTKWDNGKIFFNVPAATFNAIYSYAIVDGAVTKEFDLETGTCNGFTKLD